MDEKNMEAIKNQVSNNIKTIRQRKSVSQAKLAELTGFDVRYIQRLERSPQNLTLTNLARLANGLEVELSDLFKDITAFKSRAKKQRKINSRSDALRLAIEVLEVAIETDNN